MEFSCKAFLESASLVQDLVSFFEGNRRVPTFLGVPSWGVPREGEGIVGDLVAEIHLLEVLLDRVRFRGDVVSEGRELSVADLGGSVVGPLGRGVVDRVFGAPEVVGPVVLLHVDVVAKDLGDRLYGSF